MKTIFKSIRVAILGLLFSATVFAGYTDYQFAQNSGGGQSGVYGVIQYTDVYNIGDLGFSYPALSASLPFGTGTASSFYMTVDTTGPVGRYYVGTIPNGDDIYVVIY